MAREVGGKSTEAVDATEKGVSRRHGQTVLNTARRQGAEAKAGLQWTEGRIRGEVQRAIKTSCSVGGAGGRGNKEAVWSRQFSSVQSLSRVRFFATP